MEILLVGSKAARHWFPDFREPNDTDYWADEEPHIKEKKVEIKNISKYPNLKTVFDLEREKDSAASPEFLYTLKVSHSFWNIFWDKTMADIHFFQNQGVELNEEYFKLMYDSWVEIHGKKRAYLNKSNEDFFKDNVKRVYVHDDLHEAMKYGDVPLYSILKKNPDSAMLSEEMFNNLPHEKKLQLCREEAYVTALERFLIPSGLDKNPQLAYHRAMQKLITSMSKGFFPKFIVTNWKDLHKPDIDYVSKFKENERKCRKLVIS